MKTKFYLAAIAIMASLMPSAMRAAETKVVVNNTDRSQRQEIVEADLAQVCRKAGIKMGDPFVVKNSLGQEVAYQVTYDGKLLIDASVRPAGKAVFSVAPGKPMNMKTVVTGKQYPERVDDIAWENDRTAYRLYGPALQKSGERAFGIDVWLKNTPELEVEQRYNTELSNHKRIQELKSKGKNDEAFQLEIATTYHFDHGNGLDCYKVGPTLGCGAPALMENGRLVMPYCYKEYKILDNGPLRFTVELVYNPAVVNGDRNVVEHRIISLDKGSNFNKMTVWYEGLTRPADLAAGVVVHQEDTQSMVIGRDFVAYADPTDNPDAQNFQIYVAALFPNGADVTTFLPFEEKVPGAAGHVLGIVKNYQKPIKYTYYAGSAWSKNDVRTMDEWVLRVNTFLNALHNPLKVTIE